MFKHHLLLAFRNIKRNKSTFFINLTGLSTGLVCVLLIFLWVNDELSIDKFHKHDDRLYQVMEHLEQSQGLWTISITSGPTAETLAEEMPEVEYGVTTTHVNDYILSMDSVSLKADGLYVSTDYFKVFSYELIHGDENQVLSDQNAIVLSESLATKLFGRPEHAIGKLVGWQHEKHYQVSGIYKDIPRQSSYRPEFLLTFEEYKDRNNGVTKWNNIMPRGYLLLKEGTDIDKFNAKIADFIQVKTNGDITHRTQFVTPYSDRYLHGHYENGVQKGGRIEYVRLFSIIAIVVLLIACINFMNLSTAQASRRIKEVGIKKVIGTRRGILIIQYLSETLVIALLSLSIALLLVLLLLPQFNSIMGKQLSLDLNPVFMLWLLGIVTLTGLIAGCYPAFYVSGFNPSTILKGNKISRHLNSMIGEVMVRNGLVVFQFVLSVGLMVSVWVVHKQIEFVQTQNLGYEKENVILFDKDGALREDGKLEVFLSELRKMSGVANASSMGHDITGYQNSTGGIKWPGKDPDDQTAFEQVAVNFGMLETLGLEMKDGRSFSQSFGTDSEKVIFNEAAIEYMGFSDPIGKIVSYHGRDAQIIGVVKDFHVDSFRENIKPLFFYLSPNATSKIFVRIEAGKEQEVIDELEQYYQAINPGFVLAYRFLTDDYQALYKAETRVSKLSKYFASIAIIIACLGLFGLTAFTAERRLKEIGIRKILGAHSLGIAYLLVRDITKIVLIAIVIGLPISYYIADQWLSDFTYKTSLSWWIFAVSGFGTLLIAWATVGVQTVKASIVNPAKIIRSE